MARRLDDRVVIVTGGARGLGAGISRRFAEEGAVVVVADIIDGTETVASLPVNSSSGRKGKYVHLDVTDTPEVERVIAEVAEEYGSLDVLMNNAGVAQPILDLIETSDEVLDRVFAVNVRGVLACSRAAGKIMLAQGGGRIVNTASQVGKVGWPGWGAYSASKAAVINFTQVLARELAPTVVVNAICPGTMETDMTRTGFRNGAKEGEDWEENLAAHTAAIPFQRLGTPADIGNLAVFLASDECSFTTGAAVNLTGGEQVFF